MKDEIWPCVCVPPPLQGNDQQQGEGDGCSGAQLRQLQPAAAERRTGGAQQQHGGLPDRQVDGSDTHIRKSRSIYYLYQAFQATLIRLLRIIIGVNKHPLNFCSHTEHGVHVLLYHLSLWGPIYVLDHERARTFCLVLSSPEDCLAVKTLFRVELGFSRGYSKGLGNDVSEGPHKYRNTFCLCVVRHSQEIPPSAAPGHGRDKSPD